MAALKSIAKANILVKIGRTGILKLLDSYGKDVMDTRVVFACAQTFVRTFKGSNRDTKRRERNLALQLKKQVPDPPTEFDFKAFIFENYDKELLAFQNRFGIEFKDTNYLKAAFVHPTFMDVARHSNSEADIPAFVEGNPKLFEEYKTLEFSPEKLGLIGFLKTCQIIKANLFRCYPQFSSFMLEEFATRLSGRENITELAKNLGIPELIVIGHDINEIDNEKHLKFSKDDVVCDAFYALMGAIYKDMGANNLQTFVDDFIMPIIDDESFRENFKLRNPTKASEEITALSGHGFKPEARLIFSAGRNTNVPLYIVGIFSGEKKLGEGASYSIRQARKAAYEMSVYNAMWRKDPCEL
eukprot:gene19974-21932_t